MSDIIGTNISSPIVPFTDSDIFPTHFAKYGNGGLMSVNTLVERDAIPAERREQGMFVYVINTDKLYYLKNGVTNNDWAEWVSAGGGSGISQVWDVSTASATWIITHNLGLYPSVTIVDDSGEVILGDITYDSSSQITISFGEAISGKVFLN